MSFRRIIASSSATAPASAESAPTNVAPPIVSGATTQGSVLVSSVGVWEGTFPQSYAFQWRRNGLSISGATSASYLVGSSDVGNLLSCEVTATNTRGVASSASASVGPVSAPSGSQTTIYTLPYFFQMSRYNAMTKSPESGYRSPQEVIEAQGLSNWFNIDNDHYIAGEIGRGKGFADYISATENENEYGIICPWGELGNEADGSLYIPLHIFKSGLEVQNPATFTVDTGRAEIAWAFNNSTSWPYGDIWPTRRLYLKAFAVIPGMNYMSVDALGDTADFDIDQKHDWGYLGNLTPPHATALEKNRIKTKTKHPDFVSRTIISNAKETFDSLKWLIQFEDWTWSKDSSGSANIYYDVIDPRDPSPIVWKRVLNYRGLTLHLENPPQNQSFLDFSPFDRSGIYGWNLKNPDNSRFMYENGFGIEINGRRFFIMYSAPECAFDVKNHQGQILGKSPQDLTDEDFFLLFTPQVKVI